MKLPAIIHAVLLGVTAALSLPREPSDGFSLPAARRSRLTDRLNTLFTHNSSDTPPTVTYNQNWAGAVLTGAGYRSVTGTIQVPEIRLPPGDNSDVLHAVSAWVGIDGEYACPNAILQVGVDMYMNHSVPAYWAWYVPPLPPPSHCLWNAAAGTNTRPGSNGSPTARPTSPTLSSAPATPSP